MGFGDYLTQTFPNVRITSSKRDPNSSLGRANPKSFHNVGMAWDVAPIPGMTFDQYKARVAQDGWNVREAIDEVKNPSRHATGPHWHMAVDGRKEQQPMAGNGLASLMQGIYPLAQQEQQQPTGLTSLLPPPQQQSVMPGDQPPFPQPDGLPGMTPKKRGTANDIMGSIFDALAAVGGGTPTYWSNVLEGQQRDDQGRQRLAERQAIREEKLAEAMRPRVEQIGNQFGILNPQTGAFNPTYTAPQDARTGETERLIEQWGTLPDSDPRKAMIARALRGSTYDPTVYQPKEDYQVAGRIRVKTTAPGKAPAKPAAAKLPTGFILD